MDKHLGFKLEDLNSYDIQGEKVHILLKIFVINY